MGGADKEYTNTYGVHGSGSKLQLDFVTQGPYSKNIGSRTYLMKDDYAYNLFQLKNKEFTYTVDDSQLDCGLNGALYFVQMDADGDKSKYGNAGAEMGLGYCDAQCPHDLKFINNEANMEDWKPSESDPNAGTGKYGSCCTETCSGPGQCQTQNGKVTIDANWRWTHKKGETTNCYTGNKWDASLCPDAKTCTQNCVIEGADSEYTSTYG